MASKAGSGLAGLSHGFPAHAVGVVLVGNVGHLESDVRPWLTTTAPILPEQLSAMPLHLGHDPPGWDQLAAL
ncbi:MAG TPA: hypothetical protein VKR56_11220 [Candidatus Cybelea sp.]|nr:hypothetical protein [Candidatus Cybelea sp.]